MKEKTHIEYKNYRNLLSTLMKKRKQAYKLVTPLRSVAKCPPKTFFAYSALIMGTLKGSIGRFFNFSAQSQNFTGGLTGHDLP